MFFLTLSVRAALPQGDATLVVVELDVVDEERLKLGEIAVVVGVKQGRIESSIIAGVVVRG
jgi:hypothetical protein